MQATERPITVSKLPRAMFLDHSDRLVRHLLGSTDLGLCECPSILELGCGPQSPLVPVLHRYLENYELLQIDARPEAVKAAREWNPGGRVEQLFLHDMHSIKDASQDVVIAMAVFDQNPTTAMPAIGKEIRRVLKTGGRFLYIHNEELNAPAMTASMLLKSSPMYLMPNPSWAPYTDAEYCLAKKEHADIAIRNNVDKTPRLRSYLRAMMPPQDAKDLAKVVVPTMSRITPADLQCIRQEVKHLVESGLNIQPVRTADLLDSILQNDLLKTNGFEVFEAGLFEIRKTSPWSKWFETEPLVKNFVRGVAHFGYASALSVPINIARQVLNDEPQPAPDEVLLIAYQYGLSAKAI